MLSRFPFTDVPGFSRKVKMWPNLRLLMRQDLKTKSSVRGRRGPGEGGGNRGKEEGTGGGRRGPGEGGGDRGREEGIGGRRRGPGEGGGDRGKEEGTGGGRRGGGE